MFREDIPTGVLLLLVLRQILVVVSLNEVSFNIETSTVVSEQANGNDTLPLVNSQIVGFPSHNPEDIHFYSFPSQRNSTVGDEIILNNLTSLKNSGLKPNRKLVILIHGFASNSSDHFPVLILKSYLNTSLDYNYIAVDWGLLADAPTLLYPAVYADVVTRNIPIVAKRVAEFINFLTSSNYTRLDLVHVIGHSLGAHVSGWAGKLIQDKASALGNNVSCSELNDSSVTVASRDLAVSKIWRISGLDPAGPLFDGIEVQRKLRPDDAYFVDVYHTAIGTRGDSKISGHADFYPNGGYVQPPCTLEDYKLPLFIGSCSHRFVSNIYAATISSNITACPCAEFRRVHFPLPKCTPSPARVEHCKNETLVGERIMDSVRGQFYFEFIPLGILEDMFETHKNNFTTAPVN